MAADPRVVVEHSIDFSGLIEGLEECARAAEAFEEPPGEDAEAVQRGR